MEAKVKNVGGRPPLRKGLDTTVYAMRLTTEQRAKVTAMGGAEWVRSLIDRELVQKGGLK